MSKLTGMKLNSWSFSCRAHSSHCAHVFCWFLSPKTLKSSLTPTFSRTPQSNPATDPVLYLYHLFWGVLLFLLSVPDSVFATQWFFGTTNWSDHLKTQVWFLPFSAQNHLTAFSSFQVKAEFSRWHLMIWPVFFGVSTFSLTLLQ